MSRRGRRLPGYSILTTLGLEKPLLPTERVCPDCRLVYWAAAGHDCDRPGPRGLRALAAAAALLHANSIPNPV